MLVTELLTSTEARAYCGSHGGHLAGVTRNGNQIEFLHEQSVLVGHQGAYWVGLEDVTIEGFDFVI